MGYLIIMGYLASHVLKPFSYFITNSVVVQSSSFLAKLLVHMKAKRIYILYYKGLYSIGIPLLEVEGREVLRIFQPSMPNCC